MNGKISINALKHLYLHCKRELILTSLKHLQIISQGAAYYHLQHECVCLHVHEKRTLGQGVAHFTIHGHIDLTLQLPL